MNDQGSWYVAYLFFEVPLFVGWFVFLIIQSSREASSIQRGLIPYVVGGWVLPVEVGMVSDRAQRRNAVQWAAKSGSEARKAMDLFLNALAAVGLDEANREKRRRPDPGRDAYDRALLDKAIQARSQFLSLTQLSQTAAQVGA